MSVFAEFEAAAPDLHLGPTLEAVPDVEIELERQYAVDLDTPVGFCWMRAGDLEGMAAVLERDETVATHERLEEADGWALFRIRRSRSGVGTYRRWMELGAELLDRRGRNGRWEIRMRFPDREAFTAYHEFLAEAGVAFDLQRLSDGGGPRFTDANLLTAAQQEALALAYETGFFDVPRGTTLADIGTELGVSDQAVSERLRRGQARLVEKHLF